MKNSHATHFDAIHFGNVLLILLIRIRIAHFCCCISICLSKQIQSIRKLFGCDGFWLRRISVEMSILSKIKCKFSFCLLSTTQCLYKRRVDFLTVSREVSECNVIRQMSWNKPAVRMCINLKQICQYIPTLRVKCTMNLTIFQPTKNRCENIASKKHLQQLFTYAMAGICR